MKTEELRVMKGPNMWSDDHHQLIVVKLYWDGINKTKAAELYKTVEEKLGNTMAGNPEDPFFNLCAAYARLAAYLQPHADKLYADCVLLGKIPFAVFGYEEEEAGLEAASAATAIFENIIQGEPFDLEKTKTKIAAIHRKAYIGTSTQAIVDTALQRDIPVYRISNGRFIMFGHGKFQKRIEASIAETTSAVGMDIAGDKHVTKEILHELMVPVPRGVNVRSEDDLQNAVAEIGFPLVTKPLDGHEGQGITANINDEHSLREGYQIARKYSRTVVVERFIQGNDYRFLVVGYKLRGVIHRLPASVKGDGISTIQELVNNENKNPLRSADPDNPMSPIEIDEHTLHVLDENKLTPDSVPAKNETIYLKRTANVSTGGTPVDVTDHVHPDNIAMAERIARIIGLDICGIDIMAPDVRTPIAENGGAVLEVNARPGFRMHLEPVKGKPRNITDPIVDLMFPPGSTSRIPIVAVTGTNGKTTTVRLMAHVARHQGNYVGFTCTDGIYINGKEMRTGDCSGSKSARAVLSDPLVDFAVLESARGGIIRNGLAFDRCDIGIVTNVAEDHMGLKDIHSLHDLAKVKAVVPRSVAPNGYAILNAADDLVYNMRKGLKCQVALFDLDYQNPRILEHCRNGGIAATLNNHNEIVIMAGNGRVVVESVENIPLTMGGKASFMIENILPVVLASFALGFNMNKVVAALRSFNPSDGHAPGRMNHFEINGVNVLVDYAHNPHGIRAMGNYLDQIEETKTGIISGTGDRRDDDIVEVGRAAAGIFDRVIIRMEEDMRGRSQEEMEKLLRQGLTEIKPELPIQVIYNEKQALETAIDSSRKGDYVVSINTEKIRDIITDIKKLQQKNDQQKTE